MKWGFQTTDGVPEQFVLWRFDTASFCCVINKCQMLTSDKLEKCAQSCCVVVFNTFKFIPNKEHSRINFLFSFKENWCESYRLVREAYGERVPLLDKCKRGYHRFKSGDFEFADKKEGNRQKIQRCGIASIVGLRWFANTKKTRRVIGS